MVLLININTNLSSMIVQNNLNKTTSSLNTAIERMTTGCKINHASDNATNYSIANNYASKLSSYDIAAENISAGLDLLTTAQDTISLMQSHGQRIQDLITQAQNGTNGTSSIEAINSEVNARIAEINRLYTTTEYNGVNLFEGMVYPDFVNTLKAELEPKYNGFIKNAVTHTQAEAEVLENVADVDSFTSGKKYEIGNLEDLKHLRDLVNQGKSTSNVTFVMSADIDLAEDEDENWAPIGTDLYSNTFKGTFDGNGHVIKNLKIDAGNNYKGLFFSLSGVCKNLGIENASVKGGSYNGCITGFSMGATIENCYTTGAVSGGRSGGICGCTGNGGIIKYSYSACEIRGGWSGGLIGEDTGCNTIDRCFSSGDVTGGERNGGLIGVYNSQAKISNSYSTGNIKGGSSAGGLIGYSDANANKRIENCFATGNVEAQSSGGGLIGEISVANGKTLTISNVMASGTVSGNANNGSLIGTLIFVNENQITISNATSLAQDIKRIGNISDADSQLVKNITEGVFKAQMDFQLGINGDSSSKLSIDTSLSYDLSNITKNGAESSSSFGVIKEFLDTLNEKSTKIGALSNRLESALDTTSTAIDNLTSSLSTIRDADISKESSSYIKSQILQQACATLLATANQNPGIALQLI